MGITLPPVAGLPPPIDTAPIDPSRRLFHTVAATVNEINNLGRALTRFVPGGTFMTGQQRAGRGGALHHLDLSHRSWYNEPH